MSASNRSNAALAISILAVVIAAAGVSYAAIKIDGKDIKVRSIPGNRLKPDSVRAKQVKESTLKQVPSAARAGTANRALSADDALRAQHALRADHAGRADHAVSADRIGSLTEADIERAGRLLTFDVRMGNTDPPRTLLQAGPLTVTAYCEVTVGGQGRFKVLATTSENDAAMQAVAIGGSDSSDANVDVGETFTITSSQESGTPPSPNGPFEISAYLWSRGGTMVRLELAQGGKLFSDNTSERVQCTYSGFAVIS